MTSHSHAIRSQSQKILKWLKFGPLILADVSASIYDLKMDSQFFDPTHDILRCLSLVQSIYEDRNAPRWEKREPTHMRLSGTDRLKKLVVSFYGPKACRRKLVFPSTQIVIISSH